ncbi:MAG: Ig-like domain-containing protein [Pseudomonadota bacterium]|nr:Ig-like domain-containing protein [Pseudomonadota bacterium]
MKTRIIKRKGTLLSSVALLGTAMLLTACGGDGGDSPVDDFGSNPGEGDNQALLYAYPNNGQGEISTAAPVVLRFSSAVNLGDAGNAITLYEGDVETGTAIGFTPEPVSGEPNNVLLQPDEDLKPQQTYTVVIDDLRLRKGTAKDQTLTFTTRPLHEGPKSLVVKDDTFEVSRRMPNGSAMEPVMDFSSFRFQFTQPIDRATANYGDGNTVVLRDGAGDPVDATLLIDGAYMTVDPDAEYLNAGETYTLDITADLASTYGETFGAESYTFTPKDSSPGREPAILVQKLTQGSTSRLTGKPVNEVPVNGTLLGENKNITQASAEVVRAELADVTTYTDVTPIRLPKGTVLNGAEINPILIGGEVPAGFGSGDVTMTVLSDASGYLVPNPYAENNPDALRIVHLLMDVGIATSEARANGAFTQDLLHIELVGLAEVDPEAGVLNLDAVSVVEPNILGQEYGYGMLSFQLQSYKDQNNPPQTVDDTTGPVLQSSVPTVIASGMQDEFINDYIGESGTIILNFNEPLSKNNGDDAVRLYKNGSIQAITHTIDGASIVIELSEKLERGIGDETISYRLEVLDSLTDTAGNKISSEIVLPFSFNSMAAPKQVDIAGSTPELNDDIKHAPVILSAYPGFPCALDQSTRDLTSGIAGRCEEGFPGADSGTDLDIKEADDLIPVMQVAPTRPIVVTLSKEIMAESVNLGENFLVEEINQNGVVIGEVSGQIEVSGETILFWPGEAWNEGAMYQYTLKSNGDGPKGAGGQPSLPATEPVICDGTQAICDIESLPIQTIALGDLRIEDANENGFMQIKEKQWLKAGPDFAAGGPDFVQYFQGGAKSRNILQRLSTSGVSDTNKNFFHEIEGLQSEAPSNPRLLGVYSFDKEEVGPTDQFDTYSPEEFDPNGVVGSPNSVKVLSRGATSELPLGNGINGANVGCGYKAPFEFENPTPMDCPQRKFSYLLTSLNAEVTDTYVPDKGLQVLIWPGQIVGTSLDVNSPFLLFQGLPPFNVRGTTGPQILRMRFSKDEFGERTQPIKAWIANNDGDLELTAEVDLYLDAPYLNRFATFSDISHDFVSYELKMNLTGSVDFLDDGRMVVNQYNIDPISLFVNIFNNDGAKLGYADMFIPERGSKLQLISENIK